MITKPVWVSLSFIVFFSTLIISFLSVAFAIQPQANITISGTVTGPGGVAVVGATVSAWSPADEGGNTTTDANGEYQLTMPEGEISMYVSPPLEARLASKNIYLGIQNSSFAQNFTLADGYLVTGSVQLPDGTPPNDELWLGFNPLTFSVPDGEWIGTAVHLGQGQFQTVAPIGIYSLEINPPSPYYRTTKPLDLRHGDVTDIVLTLNDEHINSIPQDPPDINKITVGAIDSLGEASVTGVAGTFPPYSRVLLVNLRSNHQAHAIVETDGSFTTKIYAPPGSDIIVKYGPDEPRWHGIENGISESFSSFPGTIIHVPHKHTAEEHGLPFAAAGPIDFFADDEPPTRNYVGAAWAMTGILSPVIIEGEWSRVISGTFAGVEEPGLYLGGLNWTHPALVDLDGDDDLELVVGNENGRLTLYRNHGTVTTPNWQFETPAYANIFTEGWAYPSFADVTNDNLPDLFLGTEQGAVEIYYNEGTANQPIWTETPNVTLNVGDGAAPTLFNSDDDQDLDLLVGHNGGLYHFENTGTLTNPVWTYRTDNYGGINEPGHGLQPSLINLDGDSDLDLLIGRCGDLVWYRNNGPVANPTWTRMVDGYQSINGSCGISPGLGDWDNDTDLDLVFGHHWGELGFYRNDGAPNWTVQDIKFPFELLGGSAPALSDWDNDNDFDMLVGQAHGDIHQYTNVGTPTHPDWRDDGILLTLPWTNHPHAFPTFADIDDDDAPELFIGEGGWQGEGAGGNIHYYDNIGTPSMPNWTLVSANWLGLDVGGWSTPTFIDINNDNDLDLFIGGEDGTVTYVENIGNPTTPNWATPVSNYAGLSLGEYSAPTFLDIDADDDFDMLVGLDHGSMAFVRNVGSINAPAWELVTTQYPAIDVGTHAVPVAVDIDGDLKRDLLIGEDGGGVNLYLYEGVGGTPPTSNTFMPGDAFQITGTLNIHGPAIDAKIDTESIELEEWLNLMMLADKDGNPTPAHNSFMSSFLTPSGFPIQRTQRSEIGVGHSFEISGFNYQGGNTVTAEFAFTERIPESAPPGTYRPYIALNFSGVPTNTNWLAANVTHQSQHLGQIKLKLTHQSQLVKSEQRHVLIWRLLMDEHVQGMQGEQVHEKIKGGLQLSLANCEPGRTIPLPQQMDVQSGQRGFVSSGTLFADAISIYRSAYAIIPTYPL